jgi:hypothetical protein
VAATTLSRASILLVGVTVAAVLITAELLLGAPPGLEARYRLPEFFNVLTLNASSILTPFIYIAVRTSDKTDSALDIGTTGFLSLMPVISLVAWAGLWVGLDFTGFLTVHALTIGITALAWLSWVGMRALTRNSAPCDDGK